MRGQKKGFRHSEETKTRISETMKPRGKPLGFLQRRNCPICKKEFSVTNITRHIRACEYRNKFSQLHGKTLSEVKSLRNILRRGYNLSLEKYFELLEKQHGLCGSCSGVHLDGKRLFVDHCHETGEVRGLLCFDCNMLIGQAKDRIDILEGAIKYLEASDRLPYERCGCDSAISKQHDT